MLSSINTNQSDNQNPTSGFNLSEDLKKSNHNFLRNWTNCFYSGGRSVRRTTQNMCGNSGWEDSSGGLIARPPILISNYLQNSNTIFDNHFPNTNKG